WVGWNPMLSVDNMPYLIVDEDYVVLSTGGFELLPTGNLPFIYDGQIMRAVGYEPFTPPIPVIYLTVTNNSNYNSDGELVSSGRSITVLTGTSFVTLNVGENTSIDRNTLSSINIKFAGTSPLTLKNGIDLTELTGSFSNNIFQIDSLVNDVYVYDNN